MLQRRSQMQFTQRGRTIIRQSPITGRQQVYQSCQAIAATDFFTYPLDQLKTAYNQEFLNQSVDAYVENCKELRGTFQDNLIVDMWVATESPIAPAVVAAIILIVKLVAITVAAIVILSAASSFVERLFPRPKFYAPDGTMFEDLAAYITYMQNLYNPSQGKPYTCMYCGQGFATAEERDSHQANCPWTAGPPSGGPDIGTIILVVVGGAVAIFIVPKLIDLIRGQ